MRTIVIVLLILWAALVGYGFIAYFETEATGDSFVRGLNRIGVFFKWQAAALAIAFVNWRVARGARMRWAGRLPIILSGGFFAVVILFYGGAILLARL